MYNPQYIVLFHHFRRLLEAAAEEGIDIAPLKGADLLTRVYFDGGSRGLMADVDFLVRVEQWAGVPSLMKRIGFQRKAGYDGLDYQQGWYLKMGDGREILFEAHCALFAPDRIPIDHAAMWQRTVPSTFDGAPCRRLSPEDLFCHITLHSGTHALVSLTRDLEDISRLLNDPALNLETLIQRADEWQARRVCWLFLTLLSRHNSGPDTSLARASLSPSRPVQKALLAAVEGTLSRILSGRSHRFRLAVLLPLLADSSRWAMRRILYHGHIKAFRRFLPF